MSYTLFIFYISGKDSEVQIIADDTDIAVLLWFHWNHGLKDITLTSNTSQKSWSMRQSCQCLQLDLKDSILFVHALSCIGKVTVFKIFKSMTATFFEMLIFLLNYPQVMRVRCLQLRCSQCLPYKEQTLSR